MRRCRRADAIPHASKCESASMAGGGREKRSTPRPHAAVRWVRGRYRGRITNRGDDAEKWTNQRFTSGQCCREAPVAVTSFAARNLSSSKTLRSFVDSAAEIIRSAFDRGTRKAAELYMPPLELMNDLHHGQLTFTQQINEQSEIPLNAGAKKLIVRSRNGREPQKAAAPCGSRPDSIPTAQDLHLGPNVLMNKIAPVPGGWGH